MAFEQQPSFKKYKETQSTEVQSTTDVVMLESSNKKKFFL